MIDSMDIRNFFRENAIGIPTNGTPKGYIPRIMLLNMGLGDLVEQKINTKTRCNVGIRHGNVILVKHFGTEV